MDMHHCLLENPLYTGKPLFTGTGYRIKTGYSLIDFDVIFPMQSSELTKSFNFRNNL